MKVEENKALCREKVFELKEKLTTGKKQRQIHHRGRMNLNNYTNIPEVKATTTTTP